MKAGIDLGTTYSLVAELGGAGKPVLIPDQADAEAFHTPSVVHISQGTVFVGSLAETLLENDPSIPVLRLFKRQLGSQEPVFFDESGAAWFAEGICALVLKKLAADAESYGGARLENAVITVPAHFTDPQRRGVLAAAALARITVLGLIEEPVAAALHYGVKAAARDEVLLVYDFGGGTFDATALSLDEKGVYVLAKTGLTELGGKEIDDRVGAIILAQFEKALGKPLPLGARTLLELRRLSEEIKIELCLPGKSRVRRLSLLGGQAVEVDVSRATFEASIRELVDRTEAEALRCVQEAGLRTQDVDRLLLVGGSSLIPMVESRLRKIFCRPGQSVMYHEPSRAVAYGAAIHASQLSGDASAFQIPPELKGVTGYHVGVRTVDPTTTRVSVDMVVKKNMPLPVKVRKTYYTSRPNQERIVLDFAQYQDANEKLTSLGHLVVGPLAAPRPNYPVEVVIEYRVDGTVAAQAYDAQTGLELEQVFGSDQGDGVGNLAAQKALIDAVGINNAVL